MKEKFKELQENKVAKIIMTVIRTVLIIMFVLFMLMVCLQRFSGSKVALFNLRMFTVATGSMEPKYKVGDVLLSIDKEPSKIKVGDALTYQGVRGDTAGKIITHEVISIEKNADGQLMFHTKGLANIVEDPVVAENQVLGVVIHKLAILSFVYKIVGTKLGLFFFVVIPLLYIISSEVIELMLEKEEERRTKTSKK